MLQQSRRDRPGPRRNVLTVHDVPTRLGEPVLTGPLREPTSWLTWLEDAFAASPRRFDHVRAVWQRAVELRQLELAWLEPSRSERLELAALLHDVGRALDPDNTEPHGFVGARFLDSVGLGDVAPLVAHHSGAQLEAAARGMSDLDQWFCSDPDLLAVLTFLDRTTSPTGQRVSLANRRAELANRYGHSSPQLHRFDAILPDVSRGQMLLDTQQHPAD